MTLRPRYEVAVGPSEPALTVSFQRYRYPETGLVAQLPRSCGALPIATLPAGALVVPCPPGEALWIGLVLGGQRVSPCGVMVRTALGSVEVDVPPAYAVAGVPRDDGAVVPFAAATSPQLDLRVTADGLEVVDRKVDLVGPEEFAGLTGLRLPPLDEGAAYGGWRLP